MVNDRLTAADHVSTLRSKKHQSDVRHAGTSRPRHADDVAPWRLPSHRRLADPVRNYASPAWSGMCSAADRARLDSLLRCGKRLGYCSEEMPAVDELFSSTDDDFFSRIKNNSNHVLYSYLPEKLAIPYQLRTRSHNITLINKTRFLNDTDYLIRMLYKYSYWLFVTSLYFHCVFFFFSGVYYIIVCMDGCVWQPEINENVVCRVYLKKFKHRMASYYYTYTYKQTYWTSLSYVVIVYWFVCFDAVLGGARCHLFLHYVQKKTPTRVFFYISLENV